MVTYLPRAKRTDQAKYAQIRDCLPVSSLRLLVWAEPPTYIRGMDRANFFSPQAGRVVSAPPVSHARFGIGDVVRHKVFDFRGVVFDIDPVFANSEEWYE